MIGDDGMTTAPCRDTASGAGPAATSSLPLLAVWLASASVVAACTLTSFRLDLAESLSTALVANGARVLLGAGVGAALALSGSLRLAAGRTRPLGELEVLALSVGAASGGFLLAGPRSGSAALALFAGGAGAGALLLVALVRALDRPRRWTNLAIALLTATFAGAAALAGTYVRGRRDLIAPATTWLLGDLGGATATSASVVALVAAALVIAASSDGARRSTRRRERLGLLALGFGVGVAGPLAFVGTLAPRTVRWLARGASEPALLPASAAAGAATVVAVDAVPRLLVGGYDFPWNVPAAMLAVPLFAGWNRARLRREVGRAGAAFEIVEIALLAGLTALGIYLASVLANVIRIAT
jgi:iron complex transport system permease protein